MKRRGNTFEATVQLSHPVPYELDYLFIYLLPGGVGVSSAVI